MRLLPNYAMVRTRPQMRKTRSSVIEWAPQATKDMLRRPISPIGPIEHHSEVLARYRERLPGSRGGSVVFHDPCYLGRYREVYDDPRAVAGAGVELREARRNRERSFCCGAGGGLVFLGEEEGTRVGEERVRQLAATGADTVAVACPFCHTVFRDALGGMENAPRVLDIAEIAEGT